MGYLIGQIPDGRTDPGIEIFAPIIPILSILAQNFGRLELSCFSASAIGFSRLGFFRGRIDNEKSDDWGVYFAKSLASISDF